MGNIVSNSQKKKETTFKLTILKDYHIKCSIVNFFGLESSIQLQDNQDNQTNQNNQSSYDPCIVFTTNEYNICEQQENTIHFMKEWIEHPDDYTKYEFTFQGKKFSVVAEILFALIIKQFKLQIENEWIIEKTIIDTQLKLTELFLNRLHIALEIVGLKGISHEYELHDYKTDRIDYNYITYNYQDFLQYKKKIERAKELVPYSKKQNLL